MLCCVSVCFSHQPWGSRPGFHQSRIRISTFCFAPGFFLKFCKTRRRSAENVAECHLGALFAWQVVGPEAVIEGVMAAGSYLDGGANNPLQLHALPYLDLDFIEKDTRVCQGGRLASGTSHLGEPPPFKCTGFALFFGLRFRTLRGVTRIEK